MTTQITEALKPVRNQHAEDIRILEETQRKFRNRTIAALKRGDKADAAEAYALALMFGRVAEVYRQALTAGALPVRFTTADEMPELVPAGSVAITLPLTEWRNLTTALRHDARLQPQLGRLAWMTVAAIEFAVSEAAR